MVGKGTPSDSHCNETRSPIHECVTNSGTMLFMAGLSVNSPRSIYWNYNVMTPRLSGRISIFGLVFFVLLWGQHILYRKKPEFNSTHTCISFLFQTQTFLSHYMKLQMKLCCTISSSVLIKTYVYQKDKATFYKNWDLLSAEYKRLNPGQKIFRGALITQGLLNVKTTFTYHSAIARKWIYLLLDTFFLQK